MTIIRNAKFPSVPPLVRYRDAKKAASAFLIDDLRGAHHIARANETFAQRVDDPSTSPLLRDDARASIEALNALQGLANQLAPYRFDGAPRSQPKAIEIAGVKVSVWADLMVTGGPGRAKKSGIAILRLTKDDADTPQARENRKQMGQNVAVLAKAHLERGLGVPAGSIANKWCMSIDVQHGEVFTAPQSSTMRFRNIEAACAMIAAIWPTVERK